MRHRLIPILLLISLLAPGVVVATGSPAAAAPSVFSNSTSITLNNPPSTLADATPYPSSISVSGQSGTISDLAVTLNNITYAYSQDIDVLLVAPDGHTLILLADLGPNGGAGASASDATLTFSDAGSLPAGGATTAWGSSDTFKPVNYGGFNETWGSPAPAGPYGDPGTAGTGATLASQFNGITPNGTWSIYAITTSAGDGTGAIAGGWSLSVTTASAASTTTTVDSGTNPSFTSAPDNSVTFTATVVQASDSTAVTAGDVEFLADGSPIAGCTSQSVNGSGQAACTTSFSAEGNETISAEYGGTSSFGSSSATLSQEVDDHTTVSGSNYCNSGSITLNNPPTTLADATPYPSKVFVSGLSGTLSDLTVTLNGTSYAYADDIDALLVGPGGQSMIVVADAGPDTGTTSLDNVTLTLDDGAASTLSQSSTWGAPDSTVTSKPVNYGGFNETFGAPAPAGPYANPGPTGGGTDTLGSTYDGTSPNGTWSLYAITTSAGDGTGAIAGGWCISATTSAAAAPTSTTLSSSNNPSFTTAPNNSVTFTATVVQQSDASPVTAGNVAFSAGGSPIAGCTAQSLDGSGQATCTTSFSAEGDQSIVAQYQGTAGFGASSGSLAQETDDHTTVSGNNYCNAGSVTLNNPPSTVADATPYPSKIFVSGATNSLANLSVTLNQVTYSESQDIDALLVGPGGQSMILVADAGPNSSGAISDVTLTLDDNAGSTLAQSAIWGAPGTSVASTPVNYGGLNESWGAPAPAGPYGNPGPSGAGTDTLGSTFNTTDANGTWSLYAITTAAGDGTGSIAGGWCVSLTGPSAPTIASSFTPATVALSADSALSFTIGNPGANLASLSGIGFTDLLPAGLVVATPNGLSGSCGGGTITASPGSGAISLSGATLAPGAACTFSVEVTGASAGSYTETTSAVTSNEAGDGGTATATLDIDGPPTISSSFTPSTVAVNGNSALSFTIGNPAANAGALSGIGFTDLLPAGVVVATPNDLTGACGGGTITAAGGSASIDLSGATLTVGDDCTFSVDVTAGASGAYTNTTSSVTSTEGGSGNSTTATLTVTAPPSIAASFAPTSIALNASSVLALTVTNPAGNPVSLTGVGFGDTLPAGLVVSTPNGLTSTCSGGTVTATAGSTSISLSGATVASGGDCTVSVSVTGTAAAVYTDSTSPVTSIEGGDGNTASAQLVVVAPPTIDSIFIPSSIALNGSSVLAFTITNPVANAGSLSGIGFTDSLPSGLVVDTPNGTTGSCPSGTVTDVAGSSTISLTGATLAASGSCMFTVDVTGSAAGDYTNTTSAVTSNEGGDGNTATATLVVGAPPTITSSFTPGTIALNTDSTLSFTIGNPMANTESLTGIGFTDTLPAGLVVSTPNQLSGTCGGGTITAVAASSSISLSDATLAPGDSCTFSVSVTGTAAAAYTATTSPVTSNEGGDGSDSVADLVVVAPPTIDSSFTPSSIPLNTETALSFTVGNPAANTISLTGIGFTDTLPAGLVVSTPNQLTGTCGGGTITAVAASTSISLTGATLASGSTCTFSVSVTATSAGSFSNTTSPVASNEGGNGTSATAGLTVAAPPTIDSSFTPDSIALNTDSVLSFTIANPAGNPISLTGVGFTDTLPTGLAVATPDGLTGTCGGGTIAAPAGSMTISLSGATLASGASCTLSVDVTATAAGSYANTTSTVTSNEGGSGDTSTASLDVVAPPTITSSFSPTTIAVTDSSALSFTIGNPAANPVPLTGIGFTDTLPADLVVSTPDGLTGSCGGGTVTAAAGSTGISLSGATLAPGASCTFSVNVTGTAAAMDTNTTSAVTSNEGGNGETSTASLTVTTAPVTITTTASPATVINQSVTDTAVIADGDAPGGSITFTLYGPGDLTCSRSPTFTSSVSVAGNGPYTSAGYTATAVGTYEWTADYSGDANNAAATSPCQSPGESVVVAPVVPGAPTGLRAQAQPGQVALTWVAPTFDGGVAVTGYRVLRGTASGTESPTPITTVTGTGYNDTAAVPNVTYYYEVEAVNAVGASAPSNEASAKVVLVPAAGSYLAGTPDAKGYWVLSPGGSVTAYGDATNYGSPVSQGLQLNEPADAIRSTPDGHGYWIAARDGGVFTFGDAHFYGSEGGKHLNAPVVGLAATADGGGYWLVASDGGVFTFGDAHFYGSEGGKPLNDPVVGMAATPDGGGYWLVASDGGVFTFGDAPFRGSEGGKPLNDPVVGLAATPDGGGYWLVASDGGVFTFDAPFYGSLGGTKTTLPTIGLIPNPSGSGYTLVNTAGAATVYPAV